MSTCALYFRLYGGPKTSFYDCFSGIKIGFLMGWIRLINTKLARCIVPGSLNAVNSVGFFRKQLYSNEESPTTGEKHIENILKRTFPNATSVKVEDISGGCGEMYEIHIQSTDFAGKRPVQQHKLVSNALKEEVLKMHGLRIFTSVPS